MLKRMAVGFAVMVLVVAAVGIGLVTASRMRAPTAEQQAALELLEQPPPEGANAFAALWLMSYDVPASRVEQVARAEADRFNALPLGTLTDERLEVPEFEVEVAYPAAGTAPLNAPNCGWREAGCLERVLSNRNAYAARFEAQQPLLQRIGGLSRYGHYRTVLDLRIDAPLPNLGVLNAGTTHHALEFVDGNVEAALTGVCDDVLVWRRLAPRADRLVVAMTGTAIVDGSSRLFAEMLESLPVDHPLPASCAAAFVVPEAAELSICEAMRGEAALNASMARWSRQTQPRSPLERLSERVAYDQSKTEAMLAPAQAWPCTAQAREMVERDVPSVWTVTRRSRWRFECAGNAIGCVLSDIAAPAYHDYPQRMQDTGAVLRAVGTLLWVRDRRAAGDQRPVAAIIADQPAGLASATRPPRVVEQGSQLQVARFSQRKNATFQLPLPIAVRDRQPATP